MLDRPPKALVDRSRRSRSAGAARQRRSRARRKRGRILLQIEVAEYALVEALIRSLRITDAEGLGRRRLAGEIAAIVSDFIGQPWPNG
jgi:hypothetical protein